MNAARRLSPDSPRRSPRSTLDSEADMLAAALAERGSGRMSRMSGMNVEREFADGDVVPGTRYRVVGLIGSGGMGSVYEVEHEELGKRFVLKALLRNLTSRDDLVHRLRNEWRALGRLEHPNIVSVTDAGVTTTGVPFYVMERLQGETLSTRLRRERRLPPADALGIAADVLDGLNAAHRIGIVHRDVKPPNVFLVGGRVGKLLDFGIAKMLDPKASQITGRGIAIGTPRYMAPEQAAGGTVDARTDLYATGLILFEMIAGAGPFDSARDANELFLAHLAKDAPPVSTAAPGVPAELDPLMARLLAKKPEDRPSDAAQVAAELRDLRKRMGGTPSIAEPAPHDDRTIPGGPFDTLEGARTVPSRRPHDASVPHSLHDAPTRTGLGPDRLLAESGKTLRLDALDVNEASEAATRTATPLAPPSHTPPPVEPSLPLSTRPSSGRAWLVPAVAAAVVAALATAFPRGAHRVPGRSTDEGSNASAASEPAVTAPAPIAPVPPLDSARARAASVTDGGAPLRALRPSRSSASVAVPPAPPKAVSVGAVVPPPARAVVVPTHRIPAARPAPAPSRLVDPAPLPGSGL